MSGVKKCFECLEFKKVKFQKKKGKCLRAVSNNSYLSCSDKDWMSAIVYRVQDGCRKFKEKNMERGK